MKTLGILFAAVACVASVRADTIGTAESFVAKLTADPAGKYKLSADIDLTDAGYKTIAKFTGILDGRGHKITGLGRKSLFTENAGSILSLTLDGRCGSEGTNTIYTLSNDGGCFATTSTGAYYADCRIVGYDVRVSAQKKKVGLFSAYAYNGTHFVRCETDESCTVTQTQDQVHIGGFVGCIKRTDGVTTNVASFVDCTNRANIVQKAKQGNQYGAGGLVGVFANTCTATAPYPDVNFVRCVNFGAISTTMAQGSIGGLVGFCNGIDTKTQNMTSIMRFLYCENRGDLTSSGENMLSDSMGGILGATRGAYDCIFIGCVNYGAIRANGLRVDTNNNPYSGLGGLVGLASRENLAKISDLEGWRFENCANYGRLTLDTAGHVGGICGYNVADKKGKFSYVNCANYGSISKPEEIDFGAIVGEVDVGSGEGTLAVFSNCWVAAGSPYTNCTAATVTRGNVFAADAEDYVAADALTALNTLAATDDGWLPWTMGEGTDAKPELSLFSGVAPSDGIPVLFYDYDGTLLQASTVEADGSATPPKKPSRDGWYFVDWSGVYKNVTTTSIVFADWSRIKKQTGFRLVIR